VTPHPARINHTTWSVHVRTTQVVQGTLWKALDETCRYMLPRLQKRAAVHE